MNNFNEMLGQQLDIRMDAYEEGQQVGYNHALDDALQELEKIYQHCDEMHDWNGQIAIDEAIETIKQLKAGRENGK